VDENDRPTVQDHHIVPKSRGGSHNRENILEGVPSDVHWAYHRLFGNLMPLEVIAIIAKIFFRGGKFRKRYPRIIKRVVRTSKAPPDKVIAILIETLFPTDWVPSKELIEKLQKRREEAATTDSPSRNGPKSIVRL